MTRPACLYSLRAMRSSNACIYIHMLDFVMMPLLSLLVLLFCGLGRHPVEASLAISWSHDGFLNPTNGCTATRCWVRFSMHQVANMSDACWQGLAFNSSWDSVPLINSSSYADVESYERSDGTMTECSLHFSFLFKDPSVDTRHQICARIAMPHYAKACADFAMVSGWNNMPPFQFLPVACVHPTGQTEIPIFYAPDQALDVRVTCSNILDVSLAPSGIAVFEGVTALAGNCSASIVQPNAGLTQFAFEIIAQPSCPPLQAATPVKYVQVQAVPGDIMSMEDLISDAGASILGMPPNARAMQLYAGNTTRKVFITIHQTPRVLHSGAIWCLFATRSTNNGTSFMPPTLCHHVVGATTAMDYPSSDVRTHDYKIVDATQRNGYTVVHPVAFGWRHACKTSAFPLAVTALPQACCLTSMATSGSSDTVNSEWLLTADVLASMYENGQDLIYTVRPASPGATPSLESLDGAMVVSIRAHDDAMTSISVCRCNNVFTKDCCSQVLASSVLAYGESGISFAVAHGVVSLGNTSIFTFESVTELPLVQSMCRVGNIKVTAVEGLPVLVPGANSSLAAWDIRPSSLHGDGSKISLLLKADASIPFSVSTSHGTVLQDSEVPLQDEGAIVRIDSLGVNNGTILQIGDRQSVILDHSSPTSYCGISLDIDAPFFMVDCNDQTATTFIVAGAVIRLQICTDELMPLESMDDYAGVLQSEDVYSPAAFTKARCALPCGNLQAGITTTFPAVTTSGNVSFAIVKQAQVVMRTSLEVVPAAVDAQASVVWLCIDSNGTVIMEQCVTFGRNNRTMSLAPNMFLMIQLRDGFDNVVVPQSAEEVIAISVRAISGPSPQPMQVVSKWMDANVGFITVELRGAGYSQLELSVLLAGENSLIATETWRLEASPLELHRSYVLIDDSSQLSHPTAGYLGRALLHLLDKDGNYAVKGNASFTASLRHVSSSHLVMCAVVQDHMDGPTWVVYNATLLGWYTLHVQGTATGITVQLPVVLQHPNTPAGRNFSTDHVFVSTGPINSFSFDQTAGSAITAYKFAKIGQVAARDAFNNTVDLTSAPDSLELSMMVDNTTYYMFSALDIRPNCMAQSYVVANGSLWVCIEAADVQLVADYAKGQQLQLGAFRGYFDSADNTTFQWMDFSRRINTVDRLGSHLPNTTSYKDLQLMGFSAQPALHTAQSGADQLRYMSLLPCRASTCQQNSSIVEVGFGHYVQLQATECPTVTALLASLQTSLVANSSQINTSSCEAARLQSSWTWDAFNAFSSRFETRARSIAGLSDCFIKGVTILAKGANSFIDVATCCAVGIDQFLNSSAFQMPVDFASGTQWREDTFAYSTNLSMAPVNVHPYLGVLNVNSSGCFDALITSALPCQVWMDLQIAFSVNGYAGTVNISAASCAFGQVFQRVVPMCLPAQVSNGLPESVLFRYSVGGLQSANSYPVIRADAAFQCVVSSLNQNSSTIQLTAGEYALARSWQLNNSACYALRSRVVSLSVSPHICDFSESSFNDNGCTVSLSCRSYTAVNATLKLFVQTVAHSGELDVTVLVLPGKTATAAAINLVYSVQGGVLELAGDLEVAVQVSDSYANSRLSGASVWLACFIAATDGHIGSCIPMVKVEAYLSMTIPYPQLVTGRNYTVQVLEVDNGIAVFASILSCNEHALMVHRSSVNESYRLTSSGVLEYFTWDAVQSNKSGEPTLVGTSTSECQPWSSQWCDLGSGTCCVPGQVAYTPYLPLTWTGLSDVWPFTLNTTTLSLNDGVNALVWDALVPQRQSHSLLSALSTHSYVYCACISTGCTASSCSQLNVSRPASREWINSWNVLSTIALPYADFFEAPDNVLVPSATLFDSGFLWSTSAEAQVVSLRDLPLISLINGVVSDKSSYELYSGITKAYLATCTPRHSGVIHLSNAVGSSVALDTQSQQLYSIIVTPSGARASTQLSVDADHAGPLLVDVTLTERSTALVHNQMLTRHTYMGMLTPLVDMRNTVIFPDVEVNGFTSQDNIGATLLGPLSSGMIASTTQQDQCLYAWGTDCAGSNANTADSIGFCAFIDGVGLIFQTAQISVRRSVLCLPGGLASNMTVGEHSLSIYLLSMADFPVADLRCNISNNKMAFVSNFTISTTTHIPFSYANFSGTASCGKTVTANTGILTTVAFFFANGTRYNGTVPLSAISFQVGTGKTTTSYPNDFELRLTNKSLSFNSKGELEARFVAPYKGSTTLNLYVYGTLVSPVNCPLTISKAAFSAAKSTIKGILTQADSDPGSVNDVYEESSFSVVAGAQRQLQITFRGTNGAAETYSGLSFTWSMNYTGPLRTADEIGAFTSAVVPCDVSIPGAETTLRNIWYTCYTAGFYNLSVYQAGNLVATVLSIQVIPGRIDPTSTAIIGPTSIVLGTCASFRLVLKDQYHNRLVGDATSMYKQKFTPRLKALWIPTDGSASTLASAAAYSALDISTMNSLGAVAAMQQLDTGRSWFGYIGSGVLQTAQCAFGDLALSPGSSYWLRVSLVLLTDVDAQTWQDYDVGTPTVVYMISGPPDARTSTTIVPPGSVSLGQGSLHLILRDQFNNSCLENHASMVATLLNTSIVVVAWHKTRQYTSVLPVLQISNASVEYSLTQLQYGGGYMVVAMIDGAVIWPNGTALPSFVIDAPSCDGAVYLSRVTASCNNDTSMSLRISLSTDIGDIPNCTTAAVSFSAYDNHTGATFSRILDGSEVTGEIHVVAHNVSKSMIFNVRTLQRMLTWRNGTDAILLNTCTAPVLPVCTSALVVSGPSILHNVSFQTLAAPIYVANMTLGSTIAADGLWLNASDYIGVVVPTGCQLQDVRVINRQDISCGVLGGTVASCAVDNMAGAVAISANFINGSLLLNVVSAPQTQLLAMPSQYLGSQISLRNSSLIGNLSVPLTYAWTLGQTHWYCGEAQAHVYIDSSLPATTYGLPCSQPTNAPANASDADASSFRLQSSLSNDTIQLSPHSRQSVQIGIVATSVYIAATVPALTQLCISASSGACTEAGSAEGFSWAASRSSSTTWSVEVTNEGAVLHSSLPLTVLSMGLQHQITITAAEDPSPTGIRVMPLCVGCDWTYDGQRVNIYSINYGSIPVMFYLNSSDDTIYLSNSTCNVSAVVATPSLLVVTMYASQSSQCITYVQTTGSRQTYSASVNYMGALRANNHLECIAGTMCVARVSVAKGCSVPLPDVVMHVEQYGSLVLLTTPTLGCNGDNLDVTATVPISRSGDFDLLFTWNHVAFHQTSLRVSPNSSIVSGTLVQASDPSLVPLVADAFGNYIDANLSFRITNPTATTEQSMQALNRHATTIPALSTGCLSVEVLYNSMVPSDSSLQVCGAQVVAIDFDSQTIRVTGLTQATKPQLSICNATADLVWQSPSTAAVVLSAARCFPGAGMLSAEFIPEGENAAATFMLPIDDCVCVGQPGSTLLNLTGAPMAPIDGLNTSVLNRAAAARKANSSADYIGLDSLSAAEISLTVTSLNSHKRSANSTRVLASARGNVCLNFDKASGRWTRVQCLSGELKTHVVMPLEAFSLGLTGNGSFTDVLSDGTHLPLLFATELSAQTAAEHLALLLQPGTQNISYLIGSSIQELDGLYQVQGSYLQWQSDNSLIPRAVAINETLSLQSSSTSMISFTSASVTCPFMFPYECAGVACAQNASTCQQWLASTFLDNAQGTALSAEATPCRQAMIVPSTANVPTVWYMGRTQPELSCGTGVPLPVSLPTDWFSDGPTCALGSIPCHTPFQHVCVAPSAWPYSCPTAPADGGDGLLAPITCPPGDPVRCRDNKCVKSLVQCSGFDISLESLHSLSVGCTAGFTAAFGMCVQNSEIKNALSAVNTCNRQGLILCPGAMQCAYTAAQCDKLPTCSIDAPYWCAINQQCMKNVAACMWTNDLTSLTLAHDGGLPPSNPEPFVRLLLVAGQIQGVRSMSPSDTSAQTMGSWRCPRALPFMCAAGTCVGSELLAQSRTWNVSAVNWESAANRCPSQTAILSSGPSQRLDVQRCPASRPVLCNVSGVPTCVEGVYFASSTTGVELCDRSTVGLGASASPQSRLMSRGILTGIDSGSMTGSDTINCSGILLSVQSPAVNVQFPLIQPHGVWVNLSLASVGTATSCNVASALATDGSHWSVKVEDCTTTSAITISITWPVHLVASFASPSMSDLGLGITLLAGNYKEATRCNVYPGLASSDLCSAEIQYTAAGSSLLMQSTFRLAAMEAATIAFRQEQVSIVETPVLAAELVTWHYATAGGGAALLLVAVAIWWSATAGKAKTRVMASNPRMDVESKGSRTETDDGYMTSKLDWTVNPMSPESVARPVKVVANAMQRNEGHGSVQRLHGSSAQPVDFFYSAAHAHFQQQLLKQQAQEIETRRQPPTKLVPLHGPQQVVGFHMKFRPQRIRGIHQQVSGFPVRKSAVLPKQANYAPSSTATPRISVLPRRGKDSVGSPRHSRKDSYLSPRHSRNESYVSPRQSRQDSYVSPGHSRQDAEAESPERRRARTPADATARHTDTRTPGNATRGPQASRRLLVNVSPVRSPSASRH